MTDMSASEVELLRARLRAAVLALSPEEQKELLKMIRRRKAEREQNHTAASRS
nr:MAG TPA: hypothetical protein [Caudoviricetes sp.]